MSDIDSLIQDGISAYSSFDQSAEGSERVESIDISFNGKVLVDIDFDAMTITVDGKMANFTSEDIPTFPELRFPKTITLEY